MGGLPPPVIRLVLMMVVSAVWFLAPARGGFTSGLAPLACTPTSGPLYSDFNADGYADVAIAIYSENIGSEADAALSTESPRRGHLRGLQSPSIYGRGVCGLLGGMRPLGFGSTQ